MKKILFVVCNYYSMGGIERSLDCLIKELDKKKWDITVLSLKDKDNINREIPNIKIKHLSWYEEFKKDITTPFRSLLKNKLNKNIKCGFTLVLYKILSIITKDRNLINRFLLKQYPIFDEKYDIAVAYEYPPNHILDIVKFKIKSIKKCVWIHFDISNTDFFEKKQTRLKNLLGFDKIYTVSNKILEYIKDELPELKDNTECFYNILDKDMLNKAKEDIGLKIDKSKISILTIARLSGQKGIDIAIDIAKELKYEGYNFIWHIVGEGEERQNLEKKIESYNLNKCFILQGNQNNPYPYLKKCDLYVQPSRTEGYCITLAEARVFCKPIVSTDFYGAKEQIKNNKTGLLVKCSKEDIKGAIKLLINNEDLKQSFVENLKKESPLNNKDLYKLEQL